MYTIANIESMIIEIMNSNEIKETINELDIQMPTWEINNNIRGLGLLTYYTKQNLFGDIVEVNEIDKLSMNSKKILNTLYSFPPFMRKEIAPYVIKYIARHELRHAYQTVYAKQILLDQQRQKKYMSISLKYDEGKLPAEVDADNFAISKATNEIDTAVCRYMTYLHKRTINWEEQNQAFKDLRLLMKKIILPKAKKPALVATGLGVLIGIGYAIYKKGKK